MKKTIELNYGTSITLNRGNYENFKPMWHEKVVFELNSETQEEVEKIEGVEFNRLKTRLDKYAEDEWQKSKINLSNVRIRVKDGRSYPSVTSILQPDKLDIDPEYGLRGQEIERLCIAYIKTGQWEVPSITLQKLHYEEIKYKEFFEKYKDALDFQGADFKKEIFHQKRMYSGEIDAIFNIAGIPTPCDIKTGLWSWRQLVAYAKCFADINQVAVFDLKACKLEILGMESQEAQIAWEDFLILRGAFKSRFGI